MNYSNFLTVRELTVLIKYNLENDIRFKNILVKGEISNLKIHPSGHWYFTLKDKFSRISAVMFSSYAKNVKIRITEGMQVILTEALAYMKMEEVINFTLIIFNQMVSVLYIYNLKN